MLAVVTIPWVHKGAPAASHEGALYAALSVIGGGDAALAQRLHDDPAPPPFSAHLDAGLLRIGCLTTEVFLAVAGSSVAYKARREREDSFETLLERAAGRRTIKLVFATPTGFSFNRQTHVLPEARMVFGSLAKRWASCGGPSLPDLRADEAVVVSLKVQTRKRTLKRYVQYGVTGYALYRVPEDVARWYHALALFAEYAGVGARTSQGFGRVNYEQLNAERTAAALPAAQPDATIPLPA